VIPARFAYLRPASLAEAVEQLGRHRADAKVLAGGQSLIPLLKLRLSSPRLLVDISGLADLAYVRQEGDHVAIGALTRHHDLAADPVARERAPLLAHAAGRIGDPQIRHRGTVGGSLAHADPAADLPAVLLVYEAQIVAVGPRGERRIPCTDFFTGLLGTALAPDEIIREIRVPALAGAGWSFQKLARRAIDWATVGVAALWRDDTRRVALMSMAPTSLRARGVERALARGASPGEAAAAVLEGAEPPTDSWASGGYRARVARVLTAAALDEAQRRWRLRSS
jgi:carbon-monoxide dehydrogenase medium subunit